MKKILKTTLTTTLITTLLIAAPVCASTWQNDLKLDSGFSQTTFDDWAAGGENSNAWNAKLSGDFTNTLPSYTWQQKIKTVYGRIDQGGQDRKTEDELRYQNILTFSNYPNWKPYTSLDLLTQLDDGFNYDVSDSQAVSFFFDPAYLTASAGASHSFDHANLRLGFAAKQTIANDTTIVKEETEMGAEAAVDYKNKYWDTFDVASDVTLFYNFGELKETDVIANVTISTQLNKFVHWIYEFNMIYNRDVTGDLQRRQSNRLGIRVDLI